MKSATRSAWLAHPHPRGPATLHRPTGTEKVLNLDVFGPAQGPHPPVGLDEDALSESPRRSPRTGRPREILTVDELQTIAKDRLPPGAYVTSRAAQATSTMRDNIEAFARAVPPTGPRRYERARCRRPCWSAHRAAGRHRAVRPQGLLEGEVAMARAATAANTFMALSMGANRTIEEVGSAAGCPLWFQPYLFDDQAYLEQDFTSSIGDLIDALDNIDTRGETALNDALYLSLDHMKEGHRDKKALGCAVRAARGLGGTPGLEGRRPRGPPAPLALVVKGCSRRPTRPCGRGTARTRSSCRTMAAASSTTRRIAGRAPAIVEAVAGRAEVILDGGVRREIGVERSPSVPGGTDRPRRRVEPGRWRAGGVGASSMLSSSSSGDGHRRGDERRTGRPAAPARVDRRVASPTRANRSA